MDVSNLTPAEIKELAVDSENIDEVRAFANALEISFSGNSGIDTIKKKIASFVVAVDEPTPAPAPKPKKARVYCDQELMTMDRYDPTISKQLQRQIIKAQELSMRRVHVMNLDPRDNVIAGEFKTVYNKFTGKVSKYVPFGDEAANGWHLPQILITSLQNAKYIMRKEIRSTTGVKKYRNVILPKYQVVFLDELSEQEIDGLAQRQAAAGAIDNNAE